jgi:putative membrane protein insertion efficiency factor
MENKLNWSQHILIFFLRVYQWVVSPAKAVLFGPLGHCRFEPSCSQYAVTAIQVHGTLNGGARAVWRVCRCHPWGGGGADPVPASRLKVRSGKESILPGMLAPDGQESYEVGVRRARLISHGP